MLSPDDQRRLERQLGSPDGWESAYRALIEKGDAGWTLLLRHQLQVGPATDHLRRWIDLAECDAARVEAFGSRLALRLSELADDEAWARAYARSWARENERAPRWAPGYIEAIRRNLATPRKVRYEVACLQVLCDHEVRFPWHGPTKAQQEALRRLLSYWDHHHEDLGLGS